MVNFTNFGFNVFKRYKNLPFAAFFFSREIRRNVWRLKDHMPRLEADLGSINALSANLREYNRVLLKLNMAKKVGHDDAGIKRDMQDIEKEMQQLEGRFTYTLNQLRYSLTQFLAELKTCFKSSELIEYSGDAMIYRGAKILQATKARALSALVRIYTAEKQRLEKELQRLLKREKREKYREENRKDFTQDITAVKTRIAQNQSAYEKLQELVHNTFKKVNAITQPILQGLREEAKAQATHRAEPITAARSSANDQLLRVIKIEGKDIGEILGKESRLKSRIKHAKNYEEFENDFIELAKLYTVDVQTAYHLIERDKIIIYRLNRMFEFVERSVRALKQDHSIESGEKILQQIEKDLIKSQRHYQDILNEIGDQARLLRNEIGRDFNALAAYN
ncbi:TPA: hypothetical protein HA246_03200 [Candidatus Woesearchaeota archaeon]|nr:hypothetical protein [Candidatus Woesearchaeota archaeon]